MPSAFTQKLSLRASERVLEPLGNTCAVTIHSPKTAALVFDKVYSPVDRQTPFEVISYTSKNGYLKTPVFGEARYHLRRPKNRSEVAGGPTKEALLKALRNSPEEVCNRIREDGYRPVLCEPRQASETVVFQPGDYSIIVACMSNLAVVDEELLDWGQVMEMRKDPVSRAHLLRFINWLNEDMSGKSLAYIQDKLATLYNNRRSALDKFGVRTKTALGSLLAVPVDHLKAIGFTIASLAGVASLTGAADPLWSLFLAGIPVGNSVVASMATLNLHLRKEDDALAFFSGVIKKGQISTTSPDPEPTSPEPIGALTEASDTSGDSNWSWNQKWTI